LIGAAGLGVLLVTLILSNVSRPGGKGARGISVEAEQLFEAFQSNQAKAEKEYKDKVLDVSGTVTESMHGFALKLEAGGLAMAAEKSDKAFKGVVKGDRVTVRGTCAGFQDREIVHLRDCELISPAGSSP